MKTNKYFLWNKAIAKNLKVIRNEAGSHVRPKSILSAGDSISYSDCFIWHLRTRLKQPGMLSSEGYVYYPKQWCALGGQQSDWGKRKIKQAIKKGKPELITILFGTNDLRHGKKDSEKFAANIRYIIDTAIKGGAIPILITIPPAENMNTKTFQAFNQKIRSFSVKLKLPLIDFEKIFKDFGNWQALTFDGVHPNSKKDGSGGYDHFNRIFFDLYKLIEKDVFNREIKKPKRVLLKETKKGDSVIKEYGVNKNSKTTIWVTCKNKKVVHESYDSDLDGKIDLIWTYKNGKIISGEEDLDRDGKLETKFTIKNAWKNET
ncbi:MAG: SGNH/GDSL hydrolase family protein [Lentisphaeria bacterium]|nr:SGNH/GDSL hydrolase family protein [Lentisphaeria bacterium]NQZ67985.1 SGNH/GDSL hydrolase family protein [Lentisphaeria bacterium]